MVRISGAPYATDYIIYDAPVNEKTKQIRERFDVDEETGYPKVYNWRNMAKLGKSYKYEDPFNKFAPHDPSKEKGVNTILTAFGVAVPIGVHVYYRYFRRESLLNKIYLPIIACIAFPKATQFIYQKALDREGQKNGILVDYVTKHPERFGEVYRPKNREVLLTLDPKYM